MLITVEETELIRILCELLRVQDALSRASDQIEEIQQTRQGRYIKTQTDFAVRSIYEAIDLLCTLSPLVALRAG